MSFAIQYNYDRIKVIQFDAVPCLNRAGDCWEKQKCGKMLHGVKGMAKRVWKKQVMKRTVSLFLIVGTLIGTALSAQAKSPAVLRSAEDNDDGIGYYQAMEAEYVQKAGLVMEDGIPYVYDSNGTLIRNATPVIDGKKYYVDGNGIAQSGWLRLADWQMYFDPVTYEAKIGIAEIEGKAYLFDENGVEILRSRTEVIGGKKYWFQPDGSLMSGWCRLGDWTMYYDPVTYVGAAGLTVINGQPYVFDENGVLRCNSTPVINGNKYYADGNGVAQSGWLRLADWQMYFDPVTYAAATGITKVGEKAYLFDENGVEVLRSRTEVINGKIYWFQPDGSLMSGWCQLGDWTMYFDPDTYEAAVGRKYVDGECYYLFDRNGVLQDNVEETEQNLARVQATYWLSPGYSDSDSYGILFLRDGSYIANRNSERSLFGNYEVYGRMLYMSGIGLFEYDAGSGRFISWEKTVMTPRAALSGKQEDMKYRIIEPNNWGRPHGKKN